MVVREPSIIIREEAGWLSEGLILSLERRLGDLPQPIWMRR